MGGFSCRRVDLVGGCSWWNSLDLVEANGLCVTVCLNLHGSGVASQLTGAGSLTRALLRLLENKRPLVLNRCFRCSIFAEPCCIDQAPEDNYRRDEGTECSLLARNILYCSTMYEF